jgi:hypothetical protein
LVNRLDKYAPSISVAVSESNNLGNLVWSVNRCNYIRMLESEDEREAQGIITEKVSPKYGDELEKKLFGTSVRAIFGVLLLTIAYWLLSGGLTFFNKWFFSTRGFYFPILVVMGTLVFHSLLITVLRIGSNWYAEKFKKQPILNPQQVPMNVYLRYLVPIGLFTGLEIGSSNLALMSLSVVSQM